MANCKIRNSKIGLQVSVLHRPIVDKIDSLQVTVGPSYYQVVISPKIAKLRKKFAKHLK